MKNNINQAASNGVRTAIPGELLCMSYSSNLFNVKMGQNNPWTWPKAALYSKQLSDMTIMGTNN